MRLFFVFALSLFVITTNAQYSQQFRGTVTDQVLQQPLAGATVTISSLGRSVMTDEAGVFRRSSAGAAVDFPSHFKAVAVDGERVS